MGKKGGKRNINTLRRIKLVCDIVNQHYESGVLRKCYKAVWRQRVYPKYPMCYRTFLNYVSTPPGELQRAEETECLERERKQQLSLFNDNPLP